MDPCGSLGGYYGFTGGLRLESTPVLGGSWDLVSAVISTLIGVIRIVTLL